MSVKLAVFALSLKYVMPVIREMQREDKMKRHNNLHDWYIDRQKRVNPDDVLQKNSKATYHSRDFSCSKCQEKVDKIIGSVNHGSLIATHGLCVNHLEIEK